MTSRLAALSLAVPLLSGCASQIGAFFNRPVVQDQVPGAVSTFAQSADRRTVIVSTHPDRAGKFCAEPPPDSATGLKTDLQASLESQAKTVRIGDKVETSITVLAARTANLDAFRTGVYALCQFNLNGALNGAEVKDLLIRLSDNFTAVEKTAVATRAATAASASE
jgi:hypothetical protein